MKSLSLYQKIFFIFIFALITSVGIIGWYGLKNTTNAYNELAYETSYEKSIFLEHAIERQLIHVPNDAAFTSSLHSIQQFLTWRTMGDFSKAKAWKQTYSEALLAFLSIKEEYRSAQVIDFDGNEILSAYYNPLNKQTVLTQDVNLQNRKGYAYFDEAVALDKNEFHISSMELSVQRGIIEVPHIPIIHYSIPIMGIDGKPVALFVLTRFVDDFIQTFQKKSLEDFSAGMSYYLIDRDGNYLFHNEKLKRWNEQLKTKYNFNDEHFDFTPYFKNKKHGSFEIDDKIYSFHEVHPVLEDEENFWYIVSSTEKQYALAELNEFKVIFFSIVFLITLGVFLLVRFLIRRMTNPLTLVTEQLIALSRGEVKKIDISYAADDEVGKIVDSTKTVIGAIEKTIKQANLVASGDLSEKLKLLSDDDQLGIALNDMTRRLQEIEQIAINLSMGNYETNIMAKGVHDKLGIALLDMIEYFGNVTEVAESIAIGKIDIEYKAVGDEDRLGHSMLKMISYLQGILLQSNAISKEDFTEKIEIKSKHDELGSAMLRMTSILLDTSNKNEEEKYFAEGIGSFNNAVSGIDTIEELSSESITMLSRYVGASIGVLYTYDKESADLEISASFAYKDQGFSKIALGEGVVGQVAVDKKPILLKDISDDSYLVKTATTQGVSKEVFVFPLVHENELFGVIEMMSYMEFSKIHRDYLLKAGMIFATAVHLTAQNEKIKILLEKSQAAFEELQSQSEELQESNVQMEEQQQQLKLQSSELKDKNDTLARAKDEIDKRADDLEKASRYKSEFLANMSHELRTPLNSIILLSKLLSNNTADNLHEKDVEKAQVINKSGNDLLFLINDILDLTKIESGHMELDLREEHSSDFVDEMQGLFGVVASEKNIEFMIEDMFESKFMTDKSKLSQVLKNLLSNSVKFTTKGSVRMLLQKNENNLEIRVQDTGIGIDNEKIESIFEAFKQVDGSISREFGGTGLGLSITKTIIELMDGTVVVESELGSGTTFIVTLPLVDMLPPVDTPRKESTLIHKVSSPILSLDSVNDEIISDELIGKNILIVDDDSRNIFTLTSTLEDSGAEVYSAFNGEEAIELLQEENNIDLILMDIMMPVMDGLTAIKAIKADEKYKEIPIIAITARITAEDKKECLDAGADEYLAKPIESNALFAMIKAWVR